MPTPREDIDLQSNDDFAGSLDAGLEFIRAHVAWTLPMYVLAVAPTALLMLPIIADIAVHRPGDATPYCWLLLPAMVWRWCVLAIIQQRVCWAVTRNADTRLLKRRMFPLIIVRLTLAVGAVWGCWLLLVPGFPAIILGAQVAPSLLDAPTTSFKHVRRPLLMGLASAGTWRQLCVVLLTLLVVYIGIIGTLHILADMVIPSFAGISDLRLQLLLRSSALEMGIVLLIWMGFDLLWHVISVIQFYHVQARHTGADIQFRLNALRETAT
ncbi:MAG: hypothetical protein ACP5I8_11730 [Phycisphaerae bacterium]